MIELGKWYKYHWGKYAGNWDILPLSIHDRNVFSIAVEVAEGAKANVRLDAYDDLTWFTEQMSEGYLNLSKDPPSFNELLLDDKIKAAIFKIIFRRTSK